MQVIQRIFVSNPFMGMNKEELEQFKMSEYAKSTFYQKIKKTDRKKILTSEQINNIFPSALSMGDDIYWRNGSQECQKDLNASLEGEHLTRTPWGGEVFCRGIDLHNKVWTVTVSGRNHKVTRDGLIQIFRLTNRVIFSAHLSEFRFETK